LKRMQWISGLIYAISYSKQFSFCKSDINCLVDCFDDFFVIDVDISDGGGNMILDASIKYHKCNWGFWRGVESNIVKELNICFEICITLLVWSMKRKIIRKDINRWWPSVNSLLNGSKEGKTLLNLLSMSTTRLLIFNHYLKVRLFNNSWWEMMSGDWLVSRRDLRMWLCGRE